MTESKRRVECETWPGSLFLRGRTVNVYWINLLYVPVTEFKVPLSWCGLYFQNMPSLWPPVFQKQDCSIHFSHASDPLFVTATVSLTADIVVHSTVPPNTAKRMLMNIFVMSSQELPIKGNRPTAVALSDARELSVSVSTNRWTLSVRKVHTHRFPGWWCNCVELGGCCLWFRVCAKMKSEMNLQMAPMEEDIVLLLSTKTKHSGLKTIFIYSTSANFASFPNGDHGSCGHHWLRYDVMLHGLLGITMMSTTVQSSQKSTLWMHQPRHR